MLRGGVPRPRDARPAGQRCALPQRRGPPYASSFHVRVLLSFDNLRFKQ